jgi:hypothetical protein
MRFFALDSVWRTRSRDFPALLHGIHISVWVTGLRVEGYV